MKDSVNREIDYMRISITDRCNLRCRYCMPNGIKCVPMNEILSYEEISLVAQAAAELGIKYLKVTGGEPLVRKGCPELIGMLKAIPGIEKVTITTNGVLLAEHLNDLIDAGIDGINVSLDTMNDERFAKITGYDRLKQVLYAVHAAMKRDVKVKLNVVSLDFAQIGTNKSEANTADGTQDLIPKDWVELIEFARKNPVDVRFIEMMPIGYGRNFPAVGHDKLLIALQTLYPGLTVDGRSHGFGPAVYFRIPGYAGGIGLISAIHGKFCNSCNRVRLTSTGYLKSCLCFEDGVDLRTILRVDASGGERWMQLVDSMQKAIYAKPGAHCFENSEKITEYRDMVSIGG